MDNNQDKVSIFKKCKIEMKSDNNKKPLVYCGVIDLMTNEPVKMTNEQKEKFTKMCSNNGEYNAVFCEDDSIPKTMELIATINKK